MLFQNLSKSFKFQSRSYQAKPHELPKCVLPSLLPYKDIHTYNTLPTYLQALSLILLLL